MSAEDWIPDMWDKYDGYYVTECKFCGCSNLVWEEARGEHNRETWVLVDEDGNIHNCRRAATANDFEDISE